MLSVIMLNGISKGCHDTQHNNTQPNGLNSYIQQNNFSVKVSVFMLDVIMLNEWHILNAILITVITLNVIILNFIMLNFIMPNVTKLNPIMLSFVMLNVIML
jgi:hypothetical protein